MRKDSERQTTLYEQVQTAITDMIKAHRLRPGHALPSEKELETTYGVSRITIRRALEELERSGQVVRSKGKSARVAQPFQAHARTRLDDDFVTMLDLVRGTVPRTLLFEWQLPDDELYTQLELTSREPVLRIDRVRTGSGRPMLHTVSYVPAGIGVKLDRKGLEKSTIIELLAGAGIIPVRVEQFMSALACPESVAPHLDVAAGSPIFQIIRLVRDDADRIIQSLTMSFRGDSITYHLSAKFIEDADVIEIASEPRLQPAEPQ